MKRIILIISLIVLIIVIILILYVRFALPDVGKAPDIQIEITAERLKRGEYLANTVMACMDCHSQRDLSKYSGPVTGLKYAGGSDEFIEELGAPGNFYAPNLTPFHLAEWTDGEIYRAITSGVSKDGRALFPAMPYLLYGKASEEDIYSVIAYLRQLPVAESTTKKSAANFPFSLIINTIPKKAEHKKIPDKKNLVEYCEYMINLAACIDCHTPMEKGRMNMDKAYSGGREFSLPGGITRSANITPDKETGIGLWTENMFVERFKTYIDSMYTPHNVGNGFNTLMPWTVYANIQENDLKAIFAYLQSIEPVENQVTLFTPKE